MTSTEAIDEVQQWAEDGCPEGVSGMPEIVLELIILVEQLESALRDAQQIVRTHVPVIALGTGGEMPNEWPIRDEYLQHWHDLAPLQETGDG